MKTLASLSAAIVALSVGLNLEFSSEASAAQQRTPRQVSAGEAKLRSRYTAPPVICSAVGGSAQQVAARLQNCFDSAPELGTVALPPGIYLVAQPIKINKAIRVVTQGLSEASPGCGRNTDNRCAVIRADAKLAGVKRGFLVIASEEVVLDHIVLDGNKSQRSQTAEAQQCSTLSNNGAGFNIQSAFASFSMIGITSMNALCGTGAEVEGSNLWVTNSSFLDNGVHHVLNMWSDGLTVLTSRDAVVKQNTFIDNTDVNLIFGACTECAISNNSITHTGSFAGSSFAALMIQAWPKVGSSGGTTGDYTGTMISDNSIDCANDRCGFGLLLGSYPWFEAPLFGGFVSGNRITGAQIGFLINDATNPAQPVQIGRNTVSQSGGVFLTSSGMRAVPAFGISPKSRANVRFLQGASAEPFMDVDLSGAILNFWKKDSVFSSRPNTTVNDIAHFAAQSWVKSGGLLENGQGVRSLNGRYGLIVQNDGNLVFYGPFGPEWASHTVGSGATKLAMQADGNLVLYSSSGVAIWWTGTQGNRGARLAVQDDGNLVVYSTSGRPLWHRYSWTDTFGVNSF